MEQVSSIFFTEFWKSVSTATATLRSMIGSSSGRRSAIVTQRALRDSTCNVTSTSMSTTPTPRPTLTPTPTPAQSTGGEPEPDGRTESTVASKQRSLRS